jgi:outer membrane protein OmpA-like peptidoglycan-associated protein
VEGHTDAVGTDEYNRWLAWDRAAAAAAYLRERGLAPGRVTTRFVGKGRPVCREATEACYARNRRVEVITVE